MDKKEFYIIAAQPIIPSESIMKEWQIRMDKWANIILRKKLGGNIEIHKPKTL
jgi:hypothetical protein